MEKISLSSCHRSSSIESYLTRNFDIRFIDARKLVVEAKVSLGIRGYHNKDQEDRVLEEAIRLYEQHSFEARNQMISLKQSLDMVRFSPPGSRSSSIASSDRSSVAGSHTASLSDDISSICDDSVIGIRSSYPSPATSTNRSKKNSIARLWQRSRHMSFLEDSDGIF